MKWVMFAFRRISFGLVSAGATFPQAMEISFHGWIGQIIVVYLDNFMVLTKKRSNHLCHLKQIFEQCRK